MKKSKIKKIGYAVAEFVGKIEVSDKTREAIEKFIISQQTFEATLKPHQLKEYSTIEENMFKYQAAREQDYYAEGFKTGFLSALEAVLGLIGND